MNDQAFNILEYKQLLQLVRRGAQTENGRARVAELLPLSDLISLQRELNALSESVALANRGIHWSFSEFLDQTQTLTRLRVEGTSLDPVAMLQLANLCEQALAARASIQSEKEQAQSLWQLVERLPKELNSLVARIGNKILPSGEIDDRASPELGRIRREIAALRSRITRSLESLMRKSSESIQDELVTIRNDRFVIPVKSDHRSRIQGVAHGYSSSGATAFIEPLETIEANNELQSLQESEAREIARIVFGLTEELRAQLPSLVMAVEAVTELDFINAKSAFHRRFNCSVPVIDQPSSSRGNLELVDARHPLLEENLRATGGHVVPVSFAFDDQHNAMVISGANAGGKTVVLKTTGLLALMALSGISVPARSARFPFYASVLADIGDHQSIAANLSTFTSHVANIARMIEICEAPALVLLDEVGTGTDPEEGSALGVAVVDYFRNVCLSHVIATTHYSGLKMYAANESKVINASVEFDDKTLQPTYRLLVGIAGASSGLEIARRFGVPATIIDSAIGAVQDTSLKTSEYLRRIKQEAEEVKALRQALEIERTAVAEKYDSLEKETAAAERARQRRFEESVQQIVKELEQRGRELAGRIAERADRLKLERESQRQVADLKREAQQALRRSGSLTTDAAAIPDRGVRVVRDGQLLNAERAEAVTEEVPSYVKVSGRQISIGDQVRLKSFGSVGVVEQIKDGEVEVRVKALRFREKLENLELVKTQMTSPVQGKLEKLRASAETQLHLTASQGEAKTELNVIGQTTDEAVDAVDKFLDEASLHSLSQVRIVHGHGTGALRKAISNLLNGHPHVARFLAAPPDQGGTGATVVELRQ